MRIALLVVVVGCSGKPAAEKERIETFENPSVSMEPTLRAGAKLQYVKGKVERGDVVVFDMPCQPDRQYVKRVVATAGDTIEVRCNVVYANGQALAAKLVEKEQSYEELADGDRIMHQASRYRETLGAASYELYDEVERAAGRPGDRDFPRLDELKAPSCATIPGTGGKDQPLGTVVETKSEDPCKPQRHFVVPNDAVFVIGDNRNNSNDSRFWGVVPLAKVRGRMK